MKNKLQCRNKTGLFGAGLFSLIAACGDGMSSGLTRSMSSDETFSLPEASSLGFSEHQYDDLQRGEEMLSSATSALVDDVNFSDPSGTSIVGAVEVTLDKNGLSLVAIQIGRYSQSPDFSSDFDYDFYNDKTLVIHSEFFNRGRDLGAQVVDEALAGKIIIFWDVKDIFDTSTDISEVPRLDIYGASEDDRVGVESPFFIKIGGTSDRYDMLVMAPNVNYEQRDHAGAIYILWDIADYADQVDAIDLAEAGDTISGSTYKVLTIFGAGASELERLGTNNNVVLYEDFNGEKAMLDFDGKGAKDIIFQDSDYTYILFGEKVGDKTATIDLAAITLKGSDPVGFFNYDIDGVTDVENVGYRFADRDHAGIEAVRDDFYEDNPSFDPEVRLAADEAAAAELLALFTFCEA